MDRELKSGEWLDHMGDPDVVDEMNQMLDALGVPKVKPEQLLQSGFKFVGEWLADDEGIKTSEKMPKDVATVYAFDLPVSVAVGLESGLIAGMEATMEHAQQQGRRLCGGETVTNRGAQ
jgi:hypothetical protein